MIQRSAPAKLNLYLRTRGLRADGFHNLNTVMVALDLADSLSIEPSSTLKLSSPLGLPLDEDLAGRAALALQGNRQLPGAHLHIRKIIPSGGGLGGGSSNAAAALLALDRYWQLNTPFSHLMKLAAELGSDVPFFLTGETCLAQGRGEKLSLINAQKIELFGCLLFPDQPVATPDAYRWLDEDGLAEDPAAEEGLKNLIDALEKGDSEGVLASRYNSFTEPVRRRVDVVNEGLQFLESVGLHELLCGSGSTVVGLSNQVESCRVAAENAPFPAQVVRLMGTFPASSKGTGLPKGYQDRA